MQIYLELNMSSPGPIPRACRNCSVAKAKCIWISTSKCERCNRLKKNCNAQIMTRQPRTPRVSHAAKIEKKLDGLMSLLNTTVSTSGPIASNPEVLPVRIRKSIGPSGDVHPTSTRLGSGIHSQLEPLESLLSESDADKLVEIYRVDLAKFSPYVTVPAGRTARDLHQETPFLLYSIIWAASYSDISRQRVLEKNIMEHLSKHLLLNGERTLDLLQGLLVYITWYHCHDSGPRQMNVLLQLLIAVLTDLGLNKASPPKENQSALLNEIKQYDHAALHPDVLLSGSYKAVLGCFYLSSSITSAFSKLDSMRYNSHIEGCLQTVEATADSESDIILVQISKIQMIVEEIRSTSLHSSPSLKGPVKMYVGSFEAALQAYKKSLPTHLQHNTSILLHYYSAEIQLYQIGLLMPFQTQDNLRFQRMEILSACLSAAKDFCNVWLSLPSELYFTLSMVNFGQVTSALLVLGKLCVFSADDWDSSHARQTAELPRIFDEMTSRMEEASTAYDRTGGACPFAMSAKNIRLGKAWYERQMSASTVTGELGIDASTLNGENTAIEGQFDVWNEDLWSGFTANWGYGGLPE